MSPRPTRAKLVLAAVASLSLVGAGLAAGVTTASPTAAPPIPAPTLGHFGMVGNAGDESAELRTSLEQFDQARTAPGLVNPGAYSAAFSALSALPAAGTSTELTTHPYDADDLRYRDPFFSNATGGSGLVAGRITGLAVDQLHGKVYAAGADGGVFRGDMGSTPNNWTPLSDSLPTLSAGDLEYDSDTDTLWYATGEANTGGTSYAGTGVYRLVNPSAGTFTPASRVGGTELESTTINKLRFDGAGKVWAATSRGIWSHSTAGNEAWAFSFAPNPSYLPGGSNASAANAPYKNLANDIAIQPGTGGQRLVADIAWRSGDSYNGFYRSNNGGASWVKVNPTGAINPKEIGNAEFSYSTDGTRLYTVLESTVLLNSGTANGNTVLAGVYVSPSGSVDGPWNQIANTRKLSNSGSALKQSLGGKGYGPGVQAWYNNFIQVDPADRDHVWLGLEEVFETFDGGTTWTTPGPYWNFSFPCWSFDPAKNTCSPTTHPDQHSIAIGGGRVWVGNDGGVYSRPVHGQLDAGGHASDWVSHNTGLNTLQYYSVSVGTAPDQNNVLTSVLVGGLQDNGGSLLFGTDSVMGSPFGGDGGDTLVDPRPGQGCNILDEYVVLTMWVTNNCGRSDGTAHAIRDVSPGDVGARFIAPFTADRNNPDHWLAGGRYVWTQDAGYAIADGSGWTNRFDSGAGHSITATALQNGVGWVTWCGPCNNAGFTRGVATNAGGTWHQVTLPSTFPNRFLAGVTIDPADATGKTAYVVVNGFNRRFTEGPGAGIGHLFRTTNGGATWANASPSLPDVPASSFVIKGGTWYLGTDLGVLTSADAGASWHRVAGFPYVTVMQLKLGPDGHVYAATHGRGLWRVSA
jgi:hypothetical protein